MIRAFSVMIGFLSERKKEIGMGVMIRAFSVMIGFSILLCGVKGV